MGVIAIILGATIRAYAVWSLRHSFTLSVQTDSKQQLVSTGIYHYIRNPAYTGIILSMLGNTFCFRSLFSPFVVLIILLLCYGIRIRLEEKALYERFGDEFKNYCSKSWRLILFIG